MKNNIAIASHHVSLVVAMTWLTGYLLFIPTPAFSKEITLKECVDIAIEKNPELIIYKNNYESSKSKIIIARSGYFPQISANFLASKRVTPLSSTFGSSIPAIPGLGDDLDVVSYNTGLSLQQTIWDFGRTSTLLRKAQISKDIAYCQLEKKKQEIIYNVRKSYFRFLQAVSIKKIAETNLKDIESLLHSVRERKKEGLATDIDVLNVESEYTKFLSEIKKAEYQIEIAKISLLNILDNSGEEVKFVSEKFENPDELPMNFKNFEECKETTLKTRVDFKELELSEKMSESDIGGTYSEWLPVISAGGTYEFQDNDLSFKRKAWSANISLSLPLFSGFGSIGRLESYSNDFENIKINRKHLTQNILLEVKTNYFKVLDTKEDFYVLSKRAKYLEKNLESLNAKYKKGLATLTELIDAQTKKSNVELELQQAIYNYHIALNELEFSIGGTK